MPHFAKPVDSLAHTKSVCNLYLNIDRDSGILRLKILAAADIIGLDDFEIK